MSDSVAFIRNEDESAARPQAGFTSTLWSVVLAAGEDHGPDPNPALEELCRRYWQPLYAFLRRSGYSIESAQDLTQSFFVHFLKHQGPLSRVDPQKGRFRCYLLACLRNYIRDERRREQAAKRGGTTPVLSFDSSEAEKRYLEDGADHRTPDTLYEKRWALVLLERVLEQLVEESDQPHIVKELRAHIAGDDDAVPYSVLASMWGVTEGAVRARLHRLRDRFRVLLRREISHTVAGPGEIEDEIYHLMNVVAST